MSRWMMLNAWMYRTPSATCSSQSSTKLSAKRSPVRASTASGVDQCDGTCTRSMILLFRSPWSA